MHLALPSPQRRVDGDGLAPYGRGMGDLTADQAFVLARDTALVLLWAVVALAATRRLHEGSGWAPLAVLGSILLLGSAGLNLVQEKFIFVDHDPSLTLTLADWHLLKLPALLMLVGSVLLAKAVLADRQPVGRVDAAMAEVPPESGACSSTSSSTPAPTAPPTAPAS